MSKFRNITLLILAINYVDFSEIRREKGLGKYRGTLRFPVEFSFPKPFGK